MIRFGTVIDPERDLLFAGVVNVSGWGVVLPRAAMDDYARPRTANVDCVTTQPFPAPTRADDGTEPNRYIVPAGKVAPTPTAQGWRFGHNAELRTAYTRGGSPEVGEYYRAVITIAPPYFPEGVAPRQWCLSQVDSEEIGARTVEGTLIQYGAVGIGVGHYTIRCCSLSDLTEGSACILVLLPSGELQYHFPLWGAVSTVQVELRRLTMNTVLLRAVAGDNEWAQVVDYALPDSFYSVRRVVEQRSYGGCAPPAADKYGVVRSIGSTPIAYALTTPPVRNRQPQGLYVRVVAHADALPLTLSVAYLDARGDWTPMDYDAELGVWYARGAIPETRLRIETNGIVDRITLLDDYVVLYPIPRGYSSWVGRVVLDDGVRGVPGHLMAGYELVGSTAPVLRSPAGNYLVQDSATSRELVWQLRHTGDSHATEGV